MAKADISSVFGLVSMEGSVILRISRLGILLLTRRSYCDNSRNNKERRRRQEGERRGRRGNKIKTGRGSRLQEDNPCQM